MFLKKLIDTTKRAYENISTNELVRNIVGYNRNLDNNFMYVRGHVTVIKNLGKVSEELIVDNVENLLVDSGRDQFHKMLYQDTVAIGKGFNFIALTTNADTPLNTDTDLTGELDNTNGLQRAEADSKTHTTGSITTTLVKQFQATGSQSNIAKSALFDAVSGGIVSHILKFTTVVSLVNNDTLTVTWTLTLQ